MLNRYFVAMEFRQLEAFVVVATELHFGRAAEKLYIGQPTLSDLIRRLERELGTPLLTRTTRRVALTEAGAELLNRSKTILDDLAAASVAVRQIAGGEGGTVRVGITPPVAPTLAPYLRASFAEAAPAVEFVQSQLWLPTLLQAVADGDVDVAITCGLLSERDGVANEVFCSQPLLVGLRPQHRLAGHSTVSLAELTGDVLGATAESLFPAWAIVQTQALRATGIQPPQVPLVATDLAAAHWMDQPELDWIMLIDSLTGSHTETVIRRVHPGYDVPFTLQWNPNRAQTPAVARFVNHALTTPPPTGWATGPAHLRHDNPAVETTGRSIDRRGR
jgi:DNA-binding transcriptional LysR family regulator